MLSTRLLIKFNLDDWFTFILFIPQIFVAPTLCWSPFYVLSLPTAVNKTDGNPCPHGADVKPDH